MKLAWAFIWPVLKVIGGYSLLLITGYMAIEKWSINTAHTVVDPVRKEMMAVRDADFEHINGRFDRTEQKLDKIIDMIARNK